MIPAVAKQIPMYPILTQPKGKIPGGFYFKAKCIQNSAIAIAPPHVREIWDWLLKEANYRPNLTHGTMIERGQLLTDYSEIIEGLHWREGFVKKYYKKHHVDYAMRWLRQEQMITTHKTTRGVIITVCNYERYQTMSNYENASDYDKQTTSERQATDTIHKELKELKEKYAALPKDKDSVYHFIKERRPVIIEPYVDYWNLFAEKNKFPKIKSITKHRIAKFNTRQKEKQFDFIRIIYYAAKSEFLQKGNWFTFDWILENETNYVKVLEGNYSSKHQTVVTTTQTTTDEYQKQRQKDLERLQSKLG